MSKKLILLTDIDGVWINSNVGIYRKLSDDFLSKNKINKTKIKIADEFFKEFKKYARVGLIRYKNIIEIYFKIVDNKRYKKLSKEYIKFEKRIIKRYLSPKKNAKTILKELKRITRIIGVSDYIKPSRVRKEELKQLGLLKYFDKIYTSHDLHCEKPESFKLSSKNRKIIFVGHDNDEIIGAKNNGFLTIGLKNKHADIKINSLKELPKILKTKM